MTDKFILTEINNVKCGFLIKNGKVDTIKCYEDDSLIGNIYVGRVSNILDNINAAFVDISKGESCYLPLEDYHGEKKLKIGDFLTVQVTKDKIKSKQASVTTNISLAGEYVVVQTDGTIGVSSKIHEKTVRDGLKEHLSDVIRTFVNDLDSDELVSGISYGVVARTKAADADLEEIDKETITLLCELNDILNRAKYSTAYSRMYSRMPEYVSDLNFYNQSGIFEAITDMEDIGEEFERYNLVKPRLFYDPMIKLSALYNLNTVIEKALARRAYLKSGGYLVIEPTEAMIVVDVNSGKAVKGKKSEEIIYKINVEAAWELARQLRLRNLSGMILVDFISMKSPEYNSLLLAELKKAVYDDKVPTNVVDITRLGLVEMTRKKVHKPLYEIMNL